ncbi:type IV secretory system conjugative DNA transfer family protein [Terasakiella pusilla]|uniref:type IV secretory system conjugative DNA transfer family protein n=1 Tax=Terasakiella pusilla TaxID=64973 RepID=UPI003AA962FA
MNFTRILAPLSMLLPIAAMAFWWNAVNQFNGLELRWWIWLLEYSSAAEDLPQGFHLPVYLLAPFILILPFTINWWGNRAINKTRGDQDSSTLHGSARWAKVKDLKRAGLLKRTWFGIKEKDGVVVGGIAKGKEVIPLCYSGPEHIMAFMPTRSGKGIGLVIPTLLRWKQSTIVLDIKGENFALTAGWRASIGQKIIRFAPAEDGTTHRFNPLAEVRIGTKRAIADCQNIALMLIDPDGKGLKDHWMKDGMAWLSSCLLHVIHRIKIQEHRNANLYDVNMFISACLDETADQEEADQGFNHILTEMKNFDHGDKYVNNAVAMGCGAMMTKAFQEKSGVHSSASTPLRLLVDPIVSENTATSDFKISDLMNGDVPASLYLVIPPSELDRLRPLFRLIMNMFLNLQMQDMSFEKGKVAKNYKYENLLMMDEFTSIGKMEIFQKALGYMAGYGLKAYIIVQDRKQLTSQETGYGKDEQIMSGCHIRIAGASNNPETAELISKMTGKATLVQTKRSSSGKSSDFTASSRSENINEVSRSLLTPDEVTTLERNLEEDGKIIRPGKLLVFASGMHPHLGKQYHFFNDKALLERSQIEPPSIVTGE